MEWWSRDSGYTLVELLVVIGIMSLVTAFAAPATSTIIESAKFRADVLSVEASLRKCQSTAVAQQRTLVVHTVTDLGAIIEGSPSDSVVVTIEQPIRWFADGTTTGGKITIQRKGREKTITVAWLSGTITSSEP
ncbi:pilus assembly FimT family protein [Rhizomicrobium electricum]|uniref:Prepilin-type N-terminal cleavage/methylation domain-containing protein n=1 Tax=Rhizomicrobium electricum TaxID=480070 RepID=A0ABN1EQ84_9PROT|nr:prepilin-type N-terminal cleavage/methylation domain-containing protein [Rhizomicrobium electricum]NIJ48766.1 general secretion pathway protein H [Rhizomicrobium electricum]